MAEWRHTVWPEAELVYTAIGKVANTSIKTALMVSFHADITGERRLAIHDESMPYVDVRPRDVRRRYPTFCHFAVARNPFDRLVSFWADKIDGPQPLNDRLRRQGFAKKLSFADTVRLVAAIDDDHADPHFRSQTFLLLDGGGDLRVDLLLRFERLAEDWDLLRWLVADRTGVQLAALPHRRVSEHRPFRDHYDDETWELAAARYATDIAELGYDTGRHGAAPESSGAADAELHSVLTARSGLAVLDLSTPTIDRVTRTESTGGHYLGLARGSAVGQLVRVGALQRGRIDEKRFDVLVVRRSDAGHMAPHNWLHVRFVDSGRSVVIAPESAATMVIRRVGHVAAEVRRRGRRLAGATLRRVRGVVRRLRSAGSRMSRRFRAA